MDAQRWRRSRMQEDMATVVIWLRSMLGEVDAEDVLHSFAGYEPDK